MIFLMDRLHDAQSSKQASLQAEHDAIFEAKIHMETVPKSIGMCWHVLSVEFFVAQRKHVNIPL